AEASFEVVSVTPSEPVAALDVITIEFSEEIEGTFEIMAMSQIYLGTKSNGCSFEVNGKVLTITPFSAITTPGDYKLVIPSGLITRKSNGEAVTMNGEYVFTVKEAVTPLKVVAVTPAEEVTSLREITIEFDSEIAVKELVGTERISIDYGWGVLIGTTATANGNVLTLVADAEIKEAGKYPLTIPAGVVTRVSDGVAYEGGTFEFTVVKEDVVVEPLTVVSVTPADAVEALETIIIEFSDKVDVPATASGKFTIADAQGNVVAEFYAWDAAVEGNVVTLTLSEAITAAGEYTFSFAEGLVTRQGDGYTCAYSCTITVTGDTGIEGINAEAGNAAIYDLNGRKIEKVTSGGIYIVNGKKVLVK
ncbi:MAG: Ig-like domain-containing protein, partial [Bacteroidaceae bacterium]|nr:Ig-like domain-containing protein [Bacteroidaceae bacterium]